MTCAAAALLGFLGMAASDPGTAAADLSSTNDTSWTVYHGDAEGNGVAPTASSVDLSSRAWTSPALDGQLYGEPLVSGGHVIVATENDTVYALSSDDRCHPMVHPPRHAGSRGLAPLRQHLPHRRDHRHAGDRRDPL